MPEPKKCPICEGRGFVQINFYKDKQNNLTDIHEGCRSCGGSGILWDFSFTSTYFPPIIDNDSTTYSDPCKNCTIRLSSNWPIYCLCTLGDTNQVRW